MNVSCQAKSLCATDSGSFHLRFSVANISSIMRENLQECKWNR